MVYAFCLLSGWVVLGLIGSGRCRARSLVWLSGSPLTDGRQVQLLPPLLYHREEPHETPTL